MARGSSKADINTVDYVARRQADYEDARRAEDIRLGKPNLKGTSRSDVAVDSEAQRRDTIGVPREDIVKSTPDFKVGGRSSVLSIPGGYNGTNIRIGKNYKGYMGTGEIKKAVTADLKSPAGKEMMEHFGIKSVTFKVKGNNITASIVMKGESLPSEGPRNDLYRYLGMQEKNKQAELAIKNAIDSYGRFEADISTDYFDFSHYSDAKIKRFDA